jgi:hypothetical protein
MFLTGGFLTTTQQSQQSHLAWTNMTRYNDKHLESKVCDIIESFEDKLKSIKKI